MRKINLINKEVQADLLLEQEKCKTQKSSGKERRKVREEGKSSTCSQETEQRKTKLSTTKICS